MRTCVLSEYFSLSISYSHSTKNTRQPSSGAAASATTFLPALSVSPFHWDLRKSFVGATALHSRTAFGTTSLLTLSVYLPSLPSCFHRSFGSGLSSICALANAASTLPAWVGR